MDHTSQPESVQPEPPAVNALGTEPAAANPPEKIFVPPTPGESITCLDSKITYTMGDKLGEGHFGVVYSCTDEWNNELAAKVLKPLWSYEQVLKAAREEMQKLFAVRHPFITYVYDAFEYRDTFYIITERCHFPLEAFFEQEWFQGTFWTYPIAHCLLQAVDLIHRTGLVHQDIHLGNVFATSAKDELTPEQPGATQFKLGDLRVAKLISEVSSAQTRGWMLPPELIDPATYGQADHRIDIYHTGLLLLQVALNKQLHFTPEEIAAGKPREMALTLQPPLGMALEKALRRRVHLRTQDAKEFWRDLNSPGPATAPPTPEPNLPFPNPESIADENNAKQQK
jgi:serine/threonine protein kinase